MKHRGRRRLRRTVLPSVAVPAVAALLALPFTWSGTPPRVSTAVRASAKASLAPVRPTAVARPEYLTRTYRAPPELVDPGSGGMLRIPRLGIEAPVDGVDLDGTAMAVPNDPHRVGWLRSTARSGDLIGASVLAGHVSDEHDRPGALARLHSVRLGTVIVWTDPRGRRHRFRTVRVALYPRDRGLPAALFAADGQHRLVLVTCAERVSTGAGFHYRSNLVVSAVPLN